MQSCGMKGQLQGDGAFYNLVQKRESSEKSNPLNRISLHSSTNARKAS